MSLHKLVGSQTYIYGTGKFASRIKCILEKENIEVLAFLELNKKISSFEQLPVIGSSNLETINNAVPVVIGLGNPQANIRSITCILEELHLTLINPVEFAISAFNSAHSFENYWLTGDLSVYRENSEQIEHARSILSDEKSRNIFDNIISYRKSGDLFYLPQKLDAHLQYLAPDLPWGTFLQDGVAVLDGGAFDGDTYENFLQNNVNVRFWNFIEPDLLNFKKIRSKYFQTKVDFDFMQICLSNSNGVTNFNSTGILNNGSRISINGDTQISTKKIDSLPNVGQYNFMKFDIEGEELNALKGGISTIMKNEPVLAVSTYHLPEHHWQILNYLSSHLHHYAYYLRVHGEQTFDTILYAFPHRFNESIIIEK